MSEANEPAEDDGDSATADAPADDRPPAAAGLARSPATLAGDILRNSPHLANIAAERLETGGAYAAALTANRLPQSNRRRPAGDFLTGDAVN